jgi:hypothetical protein
MCSAWLLQRRKVICWLFMEDPRFASALKLLKPNLNVELCMQLSIQVSSAMKTLESCRLAISSLRYEACSMQAWSVSIFYAV